MSIQIQNLSKVIDKRVIFKDVSFNWPTGQILGLVGRNGVGKTTLFRTLTDDYLPTAGHIKIDDVDVRQRPSSRQKLFYIDTQNNFFRHQTLTWLADTYALAYPEFDRQRLIKLLAEEKLPLTSHYQQLSKGQRMLFQILLALVSGTPYIILDEPFDGLDVLVRERIVTRIVNEMATRQTSFLISSHNLDELDGLCDRVLFLKDQQLVADYDLEDFRATARKLQLVFASKELPAVIKQHGTIVKVYGRVLEVYFENYTPTVKAALLALKPVMMTECPLTLTDIFRVKLGDQHTLLVGE